MVGILSPSDKKAGSGSEKGSQVSGTDPKIRIRTKISRTETVTTGQWLIGTVPKGLKVQ